MLVGLDLLKQIEEIIERAYTDFTYRLIGADFLTDEQKTQVEALGFLVGRRPLLELLYLLVRQINSPNYKKDVGLNMLLDQIALSNVLPTLRDTDKYTLDHAKASVREAIETSKAQLKKQIKYEVLKINSEYKEEQAITLITNVQKEHAKIQSSSSKLIQGLTYAAVGGLAFKLFRKDFTSAMTNMINSAVVDQVTSHILQIVSTGQSQIDPLVYKQVVKDERLSPECRQLHTHPDWSPRIYRLSELISNGTNLGKPKSEWKAVIGPTHPNCRCTLKLASDLGNESQPSKQSSV